MVLRWWESITGSFGIINRVCNVNWPPKEFQSSDEGLTLETLAFKLFNGGLFHYVINSVDNNKLL